MSEINFYFAADYLILYSATPRFSDYGVADSKEINYYGICYGIDDEFSKNRLRVHQFILQNRNNLDQITNTALFA